MIGIESLVKPNHIKSLIRPVPGKFDAGAIFTVRIKHIAIHTHDPEKTVEFYKKVFGLEESGLAGSGVYLSDGYINLAILKSNDNGTSESPRETPGYSGIDHLGFQVDNLEQTTTELEKQGAVPTNQRIDMIHSEGFHARSYYKIKYRAPDDQIIDVTESGWIGT